MEDTATRYDFENRTEYQDSRWRRHRSDGPAVIWKDDGTSWWYKHGNPHRLDGPAMEWEGGSKEWYIDGKRHRTDGPAVDNADGCREWYTDGKLHRVGGPAIEYSDSYKEWYLQDVEYGRHGYWQAIWDDYLSSAEMWLATFNAFAEYPL